MAKKFIIVEDEQIAAEDTKNKVEKLGHEVVGIFSSGEEAIEKCAETMPDMVLMDILLKGKINGIQASQVLREKYNLPVIFLTAHSEEDLLGQAVSTRPLGYLLKPVSEKDLHIAIEVAFYNHSIELELKEKIRQLEKINKIMVDRELKMVELKKELDELKGKSSK